MNMLTKAKLTLKNTAKAIFRLLPKVRPLHAVCRRYVNQCNGENNDDITTNGELRLMRDHLPDAHTVFDVGANVGDWATLALRINPRLNLHCFEPSGPTFQQLASHGFPSSVTLNHCALSAVRGAMDLHIIPGRSGLSSFHHREGLESGWGLGESHTTERVAVDTLDNYCDTHKIDKIDFLKMDVEGHELEVLKGGINMLKEGRVNLIQFEYGGCNIDSRSLLKDFFAFFKPLPYQLYKNFPNRLQHHPQYDQRLENFQHQNWIAIHSHQRA
jgi:FkbM family methyltransferase